MSNSNEPAHPLDIDELRLREEPLVVPSPRPPHHRAGERFLKGPIPLAWLTAAAGLPGKALGVGLAAWFLAGVQKSSTVTLKGSALRQFNVGRKAGYRGLAALKNAGLIDVCSQRGKAPRVTLLDVPAEKRWIVGGVQSG